MTMKLPTREQVAEALGSGLLMDVSDALERADLPPIDGMEPVDGDQLYFTGTFETDDPDFPGEKRRMEWGFTMQITYSDYL